jgi:tetratricopeptide (TPR) repeat protein
MNQGKQPSRPALAGTGAGEPAGVRSETAWLAVVLLVVGVSVVFTHWPALSAEASSFDDEQYLHKNKLVQDPGWDSTRRFLSEVANPSTVKGYYQPLAMISLMLDYAAGGRPDNLVVFHVTSLSFHVVNTLLVIVLLYVVFGRVWPAAIVGLLFGLHPMTVEPIPWVSERKTLLASFFALLCLIFYVRYARKGRRILLVSCGVMYVLSLMSKPTTTPLPLLLLLLDFWPLGRFGRRALLEKAPFLVVMVVFGVITIVSQGRTASVTMPGEYNPVRIPLILCHNIVFYLYKILWPARLSSHYPFPVPLSVSEPMILAGLVGTCVLLPALVISLRWTRAFLTGWLFFFVAILPTMGIIGFTNVIASDKYAYLPSAGLLMVLTWLLGRAWRRISLSGACTILVGGAVVVVAVSESVATRRYLAKWQDSETLYRYMLNLAPNASPVYLNLGNTVLKQERYDEAVEHYRKAVSISPMFVEAHYNLGVALSAAGRYGEAIEAYQSALQINKNHTDALSHMADALARSGQLDRAIALYDKLLAKRPNDTEILNNAGLALVKKGRVEEGIGLYNKCLEINPDSAEVLNNLGNALAEKKDFDGAVACFEKALALKGEFAETNYNLANTLRQMGRADEAVGYYTEALRLEPDDADAYCGLGLILAEREEYDKAAAHFRKAVQLNPSFSRAYYHLGLVCYNQNDVDGAVEQFRKVLELHPDDAQMHCNLGLLLMQKGATGEAVGEFRRSLELDPNLEAARRHLESIRAGQGAGR